MALPGAFFCGALPHTPPKGAALWNPGKGLSPMEPVIMGESPKGDSEIAAYRHA